MDLKSLIRKVNAFGEKSFSMFCLVGILTLFAISFYLVIKKLNLQPAKNLQNNEQSAPPTSGTQK